MDGIQIESAGPREDPQETSSREDTGTMEKPQISQQQAARRPGGCHSCSGELDASHKDKETPRAGLGRGQAPPSMVGRGRGMGREPDLATHPLSSPVWVSRGPASLSRTCHSSTEGRTRKQNKMESENCKHGLKEPWLRRPRPCSASVLLEGQGQVLASPASVSPERGSRSRRANKADLCSYLWTGVHASAWLEPLCTVHTEFSFLS